MDGNSCYIHITKDDIEYAFLPTHDTLDRKNVILAVSND